MPTFLERAKSLLRPESIAIDGSVIPAAHLRFGGVHFHDDRAFLESGTAEARRLQREGGLSERSRVLEIGCGTGRLPIGILRAVGDIECYKGVDVSARAVRWCRKHLERAHPSFRFTHLPVRNARYNPGGIPLDDCFRFPFADGSFDLLYLYSVFSHMDTDDVRVYLREFARLLAPGGRVWLTAFVEENVPDMTENPDDYRMPWKGPLHCVRFDRAFLERLCREAGLTPEECRYATETDGQSAYWLRKSGTRD